MPDRIIRDEILESDRWLDLPSDTDRLAYLGLRLKTDDFGNIEAGQRRMFRLLNSFTQIKTDETCTIVLNHLSDADLIRFYESGDPPHEFIHLPRSRPTGSYLVRKCPPSPWCDPDIQLGKHIRAIRNQGLAKNIPVTSQERNPHVSQGIGEGIGKGKGKKLGAKSARTEFIVSDEMATWASKQGLPADSVMIETTKFFDHHLAKGSAFADWDAAWRNWVRNAVKFAKA